MEIRGHEELSLPQQHREQDHRVTKRRCAWMTGSLSRLGMQPSPESSWRIEFESGNSYSASAVSGGHADLVRMAD
jgi:hypothetical protein